MKYFCKILIPITFLITLSCSAEQDPITDADPEKTVLRFSSDIPTKGTDITNDNMDRFGMFAFYTGVGNWNATTSTPDYMYNREVSRNKINTNWTEWFYSPVMYWPKVGEKLSFFAYAPFATPENGILVSPQSKTGAPTLEYEVSSVVSKQIDLLFATPLWNKTKTDYPNSHVRLDFKHALTKILFHGQIQTGKELPVGQQIKIKSISVTQINSKGILNYPATPGEAANWDLNVIQIKDYMLTISGGELIDKMLSTTPVSITSTDGQLNLLPQTIRAEAMLRVEYGIYDINNMEIESLVSEHPFASLMPNLLMGKAIIFTIQLGVESPGKVQATILPWDKASVEGDFSATYLNLSRTNITESAGKEIIVYYDTDYRYHILVECIQSTGTALKDIVIIPENGVIKFPTDLLPGDYTFNLQAGGILRKIYLKII